ncbi:glycosyltransferase family 2 protein [Arthrobacter sp. STN4]|uniref:glycosyltransferase family 2 protein n=1 Tax=Arthrobacter sp. STN4 TaxID=2923276 RepID=UPI002119CBE9|nr:glycosyltransferase family 2 protein [Arthrobacter sp. STN4]MCQ9163571.1 glycosyltransferase family 2 protein [Arthrobacter sp. STN4]
MVAHNGGAYLPTVLSALAAQTRQATSVLAADVGSTDNSGELLRRELGEGSVINFDGRRGGYGAAVKAVLDYQRMRAGQAVVPVGAGAPVPAGPPSTPSRHDAGAPSAGTSRAVVADSAAPALAAADPDPATLTASRYEWIWLLQDDAAPAPDALERLLDAVERSTTATVAGCKQLDWDQPRKLVDVGLKANKWFDRFALVNLDELDQGQYDGRTDFFAVNAAGMLVRRDVWEKLGGFDPAIPGPGDDLDFCARVRLAGHRVLVVPGAKVFHVVDRDHPLGSPVAARKAAIFTRLKHAPLWQLPFLAAGAVLSAVYWLFAGFLLKAPGHAVQMFAATFAGLFHPLALARSRRALARSRVQSRSAHKGLTATSAEARNQLKSLREAVGPDEEAAGPAQAAPSILEPTGDIHHEAVTPLATGRTAPLVSAVGLVLLLAVLSLVVLGRLIGASALTGGGLLPVSTQLGAIWQHATDWWVSLGSGLPGRGDPFDFVLWILGVMGFGNGSAAVLWLVLLAIPLSAFTGWLAAGAFSRHRWPRLVAGLVWAGAPVLQVAMGQGRLGALLAHVLIPLVVLGLVRAAGGAVGAGGTTEPLAGGRTDRARGAVQPGTSGAAPDAAATLRRPLTVKLGRPGVDRTPSWTAAAAAGLALAAVTAAAPSLFAPAIVVVLICSVLLGRRGKTMWWSLVPPIALFLPFAWSARSNLRALLGDPGVPLAGHSGPAWEQLLGFPNAVAPLAKLFGGTAAAAGDVWTWAAVLLVGAPVVVVAFIALLAPLRRAGTVRTLWLVALLALATAYATRLVAVSLDGSTLATPFNGPAVSVALFALLGAALLGFDAVHRRAFDPAESGGTVAGRANSGGSAHGGSRTTAVVLSVVLVAAPIASLGLWTVNSLNGNTPGLAGASLVAPLDNGSIPATAADRGTGPEASRTLVLRVLPAGGVQATLMQGSGTTLDSLSTIAAAADITGAPGAEAVRDPDAATAMLRTTVAALMAKSGVDPRPEFLQLGVGFVVLQKGDTAAELVAGELEAVPGLDTVGPTESGWLWRVQPTYQKTGATDVVNRVRLVDAQGAAVAPVASNGTGVDTTVPAGTAGRRVVLAERFDQGWQAQLDGKDLKAVQDGWSQAFELPAAGGKLHIRYVEPWAAVLGLVQVVLLGLTLLLAIPVRARRGRAGAYRDEASLHKVGRGV